MNLEWQARGLCLYISDPDIFHVKPGRPATEAKAVCAQCKVRQQCLDWSIQTRQTHGVWGGLTAHERENMTRGSTRSTTRVCVQCDAEFTPLNRNQKNCSPECRKERFRQLDKISRTLRRQRGANTHGRAGYQLGCRCDVCVTEEHEYLRNWRKRNKEREAG